MLEKLGFQSLVEQTVTSKRIPRAMDLYRFVLGIVLGRYIGFPKLFSAAISWFVVSRHGISSPASDGRGQVVTWAGGAPRGVRR